jgi:hypothetical protein
MDDFFNKFSNAGPLAVVVFFNTNWAINMHKNKKKQKISRIRITLIFLPTNYYICRMKKIVYSGIILLVFLCACRKPERFPIIPEIKLISFEKYQATDSTIGTILVFYFQDGDGDVGLDRRDTFPPFNLGSLYYHNFFCDYYEKQNGIYVKVETPLPFHARIPRLTYLPEESINGEIYIKMSYYFDSESHYDTTQIKFYIVDRKLNYSNVEEATMIR